MSLNEEALRLYAVTDRAWLGNRSLASVVEESLKGGVTMLQLREKGLPKSGIKKEALELKKICKRYGVPFIINDDVGLAVETEADGVHIGQNDMSAYEARKLMGTGKIVGVSAHSVEEALRAEEAGADYLGVGAVFRTATKDDAAVLGAGMIKAVCDSVKLPCVAIGGITRENILRLSGTGLSGVAVVSALYAQSDIEKAAKELLELSERMVK